MVQSSSLLPPKHPNPSLIAEFAIPLIQRKKTYSGGMYPNVPTRRVGSDAPPTSVSLVNPKSATYSANISVQQWE